MVSLEERVARLEARVEIEQLKYRYLRACDRKDPQGFRDCFVRAGADIDYGELGAFAEVEDLVRLFTEIALARREQGHLVLDMHHAVHPQIDFVSATEATGRWTLRFRQLNLAEETERVLCGEYEDRYVVEDGEWRLAKHHFRTLWSLTRPLPEGFRVEEGEFDDVVRG
ncbi:nuclear transport factor 2 family protein [Streptomyces cavernicola]|uniref:Nuclear transport factor 2 family protein n=1 Tax=Streptomyces cavernicola TaxID=3043613 RepID=A0ABT6SBL3_9ACTN|nr:nuclear transport factor 2 family protein [Streptomyces sp. B-S-A6]MDI3405583.1 nuclear transport factor 2 family protein [Streptomyces sp. B-S-A6]